MKTRLFAVFLCLVTVICLHPAAVQAEPDIARELKITVSGSGYDDFYFLRDGDGDAYRTSSGDCVLTLRAEEPVGALYLMFDLEYGAYTVEAGGKSVTAGEQGMLHEYVTLPQPAEEVTLRFESGKVRLSEIRAFAPGAAPETVQVWQPPLNGGSDIVLFSTHGDDDQLFFAGLLPLYAGEKNCRVQVVYLTDHRNLTKARTHEMINGLWAVGVRNYPVFGTFSDFRIDDLEGTYREYASQGVSREELLGFVVEQLRRFKPLVAVGHDINGEYGHGMHMVYTDCLIKALDVSNDPEQFPETADAYGVWDVPKTYLHLYEQNPVTIDYDTPLASFDGLTAFQVTQKYGYPCHKSQQYTWFTRWINGRNNEITKASQIETYNPSQFGLYRTTVGEDTGENDFLENVTTYAEQERLEQERLEQERLEQERLEQERLEQERLEQERLEQEKLEQEKQEQATADPSEPPVSQPVQERPVQKRSVVWAIVLLVLLVAVLLAIFGKKRTRRRRRRRRRPQ